MKSQLIVGFVVTGFALAFGTGCAAPAQNVTMAGAATTPRVERHKLAEGVEIVVSDEAGLEARRIAEEFQAEMRSRYMSAR